MLAKKTAFLRLNGKENEENQENISDPNARRAKSAARLWRRRKGEPTDESSEDSPPKRQKQVRRQRKKRPLASNQEQDSSPASSPVRWATPTSGGAFAMPILDSPEISAPDSPLSAAKVEPVRIKTPARRPLFFSTPGIAPTVHQPEAGRIENDLSVHGEVEVSHQDEPLPSCSFSAADSSKVNATINSDNADSQEVLPQQGSSFDAPHQSDEESVAEQEPVDSDHNEEPPQEEAFTSSDESDADSPLDRTYKDLARSISKIQLSHKMSHAAFTDLWDNIIVARFEDLLAVQQERGLPSAKVIRELTDKCKPKARIEVAFEHRTQLDANGDPKRVILKNRTTFPKKEYSKDEWTLLYEITETGVIRSF